MVNKTLLIAFLLFASASLSSVYAADISWNIDCGSSGSSTDDIGKIWSGDDTLIKTGKSKLVQTSDSVPNVLSTLRVFTSGTKNCYKLKADIGTKVLVRASFYYGNYDGMAAPPSFLLHYDGVDWANVTTIMDAQRYQYYEAVYFTKFDIMSICLVRTNPKQFPFISGLEIRTLDEDMYSYLGESQALALRQRYAFGASSTVRYPDDPYDRIWKAGFISGANYSTDSSSADTISTNVPDKPPQAAVAKAVAPLNTSQRMMEVTLENNFPIDQTPVYINLYFSELSKLDSTDKRSFHVYLDNKRFSVDPITPNYAEVTEFSITNVTASKKSKIALKSTNDSTLPPLLNAWEVFTVENFTASATGSSSSPRCKKEVLSGCLLFLLIIAFWW